MGENGVEGKGDNGGSWGGWKGIDGDMNDFVVGRGLRRGVSEVELGCFRGVRGEIGVMWGGGFGVREEGVSR